MKNKLKATMNHVVTNRAKYAAATTLAVCVAIQMRHAKELNEFLEARGLLNEYYFVEEN